MTRSWRQVTSGEVDAAVERIQDSRLARYEAEQDRAQDEECPDCGSECHCDEERAA